MDVIKPHCRVNSVITRIYVVYDADGIQVDICTVIGLATSCLLQAPEVVRSQVS